MRVLVLVQGDEAEASVTGTYEAYTNQARPSAEICLRRLAQARQPLCKRLDEVRLHAKLARNRVQRAQTHTRHRA
jgi:hypothetical protein